MDLRTCLQNYKAEEYEELLAVFEDANTANSSDNSSDTCSFKLVQNDIELIDVDESDSDRNSVKQVPLNSDNLYQEELSQSSSAVVSIRSVEVVDLTDHSMDEDLQINGEVAAQGTRLSIPVDTNPVYSPISVGSDSFGPWEDSAEMVVTDDNATDFPDDSMDEALIQAVDKLSGEYAFEKAREAFPRVQLSQPSEATFKEYIEDVEEVIGGDNRKIRESWEDEDSGLHGVVCCGLRIPIYRQNCPECGEFCWD